MIVDQSDPERIALQPETRPEERSCYRLFSLLGQFEHEELLSWFTRDVEEYARLDHGLYQAASSKPGIEGFSPGCRALVVRAPRTYEEGRR